ncbi:hypothetical protein Trydic_g7454 [Trypoxylus dichotomus]
MHTERMKLLVVLLTLNCLCASIDVWELFGPKLKSSRSLETENTVHDYVKDLTVKFEYPLEVHKVISSQGYILTLHRLPYGRKATNTKRPRPVVLLILGIFGSPECFLFRGPQYDLPYILADSGYDMWILNNRGSSYSKQHTSLNPERDKSFWDFSFHELGIYDLPPVIDYILHLTQQKDLFFIGYSMGASIGHVLCSSRPEYNTKIRHFINFAPVTNVVHFLPPGQNFLFAILPDFARSLKAQNISELFPRRVLTGNIFKGMCQNGSNLQPLCMAAIFLIVGIDYKQFNPALFAHIFRYFPDGTSLKTIEHYVQILTTGIFKEYDYGIEQNRLIYGSDEAPRYNLSSVTVPVSIYYGAGDILSTKMDCEYLAKKIRNAMGLYRVPFRDFNHMDFMWATKARQLLYDPLLNLLNKYK